MAKRNDEPMRVVGYMAGEFQAIELSGGRVKVARSTGPIVEFAAPEGDVVSLAPGPALLMADGSAYLWRFDTKRWYPFGNLNGPAKAIDRDEREVDVRIEIASSEWGPRVRLRALRRFEYGDAVYAERVEFEASEREAFDLTMNGYATRVDRPETPSWMYFPDFAERCARAPRVRVVCLSSFGVGPGVGDVVRGQVAELPFPSAFGLEQRGAVAILRPGDRAFVDGKLVEESATVAAK